MTPSPPLSRHPLFTPLLLAAVVLLTALTVTLALLPEPPMFPVLLAAGLALWLPALLLLLHAWNPALAADPLFRYLAAALLVGLEILIFWTILHATVPFLQDVGAHWFSPILYGLLCFPLARILEEYLRRHPAAPPALRILHLWLLAARPMLLFFSLGLVTAGIFFEMHAETPAIDPTFPLAIILPLSLLGILAALARAAAQTAHLRHLLRPPPPPPPLDDPPPAPPAPCTPSPSSPSLATPPLPSSPVPPPRRTPPSASW